VSIKEHLQQVRIDIVITLHETSGDGLEILNLKRSNMSTLERVTVVSRQQQLRSLHACASRICSRSVARVLWCVWGSALSGALVQHLARLCTAVSANVATTEQVHAAGASATSSTSAQPKPAAAASHTS
jgi:hypothetical protein